MAYNQPTSSRIMLQSRVAQAATNNTLSVVSFSSVDIGSQYLSNGSPPKNFTCPYPGHYVVEIAGWSCGTGSNTFQITSTRSASPVYDQTIASANGCFLGSSKFVIPNCQTGDIISMQANENTTGTLITSITNAAPYQQGICTITFYPIN